MVWLKGIEMAEESENSSTGSETEGKPEAEMVKKADFEALKAEKDKWQNLSRETEKKFKDIGKELESFKKKNMDESEMLFHETSQKARSEAISQFGGKLVKAEFKAAAAGRMSETQLNSLLDNVNVSKFMNDDGDIDEKAISDFVDSIVPKVEDVKKPEQKNLFDMGQGARGNGKGEAISLADDDLAKAVMAAVKLT